MLGGVACCFHGDMTAHYFDVNFLILTRGFGSRHCTHRVFKLQLRSGLSHPLVVFNEMQPSLDQEGKLVCRQP